jgi:hypothetical protein
MFFGQKMADYCIWRTNKLEEEELNGLEGGGTATTLVNK